METMTRHRNPLFNRRVGMEVQRILTVDALHALYLGVMLVFCRHGVWLLIESGLFGRAGTEEENIQIAVMVFKSHLKRFYKAWHERHPSKVLTRVNDVTAKMVGTPNDMKLKTKGAETWGVLLFLEFMFRVYGAAIQPRGEDYMLAADYLEASQQLIAMCNIMDANVCNIPQHDLDRLLHFWKRFHTLTEDVEDLDIPKRHQLSHMICGSPFFGNPRCSACWTDEALNKILKECCRLRSQATFEEAVLTAMPYLLRRRMLKKSFW
jgi:hypothetical protein